MKSIVRWTLTGLLGILHSCFFHSPHLGQSRTSTNKPPLGWRLGTQAYTFRKFTFFEAVDKAASLGLKYIEAYPGQRISSDSEDKMSHTLSPELQKKGSGQAPTGRCEAGLLRRHQCQW